MSRNTSKENELRVAVVKMGSPAGYPSRAIPQDLANAWTAFSGGGKVREARAMDIEKNQGSRLPKAWNTTARVASGTSE